MRDKVNKIVCDALVSIGESTQDATLTQPQEDMRLYGNKGAMDSVGIVMLIAEVEELVDDEFGVEITLADERAMSQKTSPFRSVKSLVDYVVQLLEERG